MLFFFFFFFFFFLKKASFGSLKRASFENTVIIKAQKHCVYIGAWKTAYASSSPANSYLPLVPYRSTVQLHVACHFRLKWFVLWHLCVYVSNIKPVRLIEASLDIFIYLYGNLPLVAPLLLLCLWLLRTLAVQGLFSKWRTYYYYYMYLSLLMIIIKYHPSLSLKL